MNEEYDVEQLFRRIGLNDTDLTRLNVEELMFRLIVTGYDHDYILEDLFKEYCSDDVYRLHHSLRIYLLADFPSESHEGRYLAVLKSAGPPIWPHQFKIRPARLSEINEIRELKMRQKSSRPSWGVPSSPTVDSPMA